MKKTCYAFVVGMFGLIGLINNADAHDSVGFSISVGAPVYYEPAPVYVEPAPVYYSPPPVVYYRPAPVYYGPRAYYRFDDDDDQGHYHHDHGLHRGWRHAHYHVEDDD